VQEPATDVEPAPESAVQGDPRAEPVEPVVVGADGHRPEETVTTPRDDS
jgi:hypothetical protein